MSQCRGLAPTPPRLADGQGAWAGSEAPLRSASFRSRHPPRAWERFRALEPNLVKRALVCRPQAVLYGGHDRSPTSAAGTLPRRARNDVRPSTTRSSASRSTHAGSEAIGLGLRRFRSVWKAALNCRSCNVEKRDEGIGLLGRERDLDSDRSGIIPADDDVRSHWEPPSSAVRGAGAS